MSKAEANVMIVEKDDSNSARAALDAGFAVISKDSLVSGLLKYTFDVKGFFTVTLRCLTDPLIRKSF